MKRLIGIAILVLLLWACGDHPVFEKHVEFKDNDWFYADSLVFEFEIEDTTKRYDLLMMVRNSDERYPYRNMYLFTKTYLPTGEKMEQELNVVLQDEKGFWLGECSGDICELVLPLQQNVRFPADGDYRLVIEQFMRLNPLPGVISIGFRVQEHGTED